MTPFWTPIQVRVIRNAIAPALAFALPGPAVAQPGGAGAPSPATAIAVLGQPSLNVNMPNAPDGNPSARNLALSNAADLAVAPDGRLYVADADHNRILSWPDASSFATFAPADRVIGQPDFTSTAPNHGGVGPTSLGLPQGLWVDENSNLWVCDAFNHRVLKFIDPDVDATPLAADLVVGQADLFSSAENFGAGKDSPNAMGLLFPGRVVVSGQNLYVADSGNSRVLHYPLPTANAPAADRVFGQYDSFATRSPNNDGTGQSGPIATAQNLFNPIGIAVDAVGTLYVADWQNHRIVAYHQPLTSDTVADEVIGQPGFAANDPDTPDVEHGLELPIDLYVDGRSNLYIADSGNHRVLRVHLLSLERTAQYVYGQLEDLTGQQPNHGLGVGGADSDGLSGATGVSLAGGGEPLIIDTENMRVLRYPAPPLPPLGDMNCDGAVTVSDIGGFVLALATPETYEAQFPDCLRGNADMNLDGGVTVSDIGPFVEQLTR